MAKQKGSSRQASSKISSTKPAPTSTARAATKSSIFRSLFPDPHLQLSLYASVIQGFDSQHLRIHDTATGRLLCDHRVGSKAIVNCLDWGCPDKNHRDRRHQGSNRKRKRHGGINGIKTVEPSMDAVVAMGTSQSEISIFSVNQAKIVGTLTGVHTQGIKDFKFVKAGTQFEGWSLDGGGRIIQWDLRHHTSVRSLTVPNPSICTLHPLSSSLLCASDTAYFLDPDSGLWRSFSASMNPVHRIISSSSVPDNISSFLTTAENDRSIRVFSLGSDNSVGTLRTEDEITSMALHSTDDMVPNSSGKADGKNDGRPQQTLLAVNKGGTLELFASPFTFDGSSVQSETETLKSRMKKRTRKASALIKVIRPGKTRPIVPIVDASFSGNDVVLVWTEGGVNLVFDRFQWRDEGNGKLLVDGVREIVKPKSGPAIGGAVMNGVKDMGKGYVDESNTTVIHGGDKIDEESAGEEQKAISISSDEEDSDAGEAVEGDDASEGPEGNSVPNNVTAVDLEMQDAESYDEGDRREDTRTAQTARDDDDPIATEGVREQNELEEPSFGDLLRASTSEPIDVQNIDQGPPEQSLAPITERGLGIPSGMSLGNVLAQSLRTNDVPLLESCFHVRDLTTVRATIERLDSSLATVMLQKLAERLHSRPGRAGSLMVWIQWTLVAHGGYLASQPALMKKLASLYRVVRERADSLESLLSLKGKLDMLEAQMNLRKSMQLRSKALAAADEDDEVVIYVEGQEESDSEIEDAEDSSPQNLLNKTDLPTNDDITQAIGGRSHGEDEDMDDAEEEQEDDEDDGDDDDDDGGGSTDANEEEIDDTRTAQSAGSDSASENDLDNVIDDEASSTSADSDDEISPNDIDHESIDPSESLVSSEPEAPPAKRPAKPRLPNGTSSRRR